MTIQLTGGRGRIPTAGGLAAMVIWATTIGVARGMAESLGAVTGAALATGAGGAAALAVSCVRGRRPWSMLRLPRKYLFGCGGLFVLYMACIYPAISWAENRSVVLVVGLVNYLWPALTVVLSVPLLGRRARWPAALGAIVAVCGTAVAILGNESFRWSEFRQAGSGVLVPVGLSAVAAVAWALYSNLARRWARSDAGAVPLFLLASSAVLWLVRSGLTESTAWTAKSAGELAFIAVAQCALAYALWERGMRRGNHLLLSLVSYFLPIVSTAFSAAYLRIIPGPSLLIGCILVAGGALVCKMSVSEGTSPGPRMPKGRGR